MSVTLFKILFSYLIMTGSNLVCKMLVPYMVICLQFRIIIEKNKIIEISGKEVILTKYIMVPLLEFLY